MSTKNNRAQPSETLYGNIRGGGGGANGGRCKNATEGITPATIHFGSASKQGAHTISPIKKSYQNRSLSRLELRLAGKSACDVVGVAETLARYLATPARYLVLRD